MSQLAGVQCAGNPHFWVNDDGSYQEEGQKNTKGYIWGKVWFVSKFYFHHCVLSLCFFTLIMHFCCYISFQARTKLVSAVLSLPVPSKSSNLGGEQVSSQISRSVPDYIEQRTLQKLLLVGYNGSGTSTIFKQVLLNGELQFLNLL